MDRHLTNKEIGNELFISESTVKRHIANMYKKLKVSGRQDAIQQAKDVGIL